MAQALMGAGIVAGAAGTLASGQAAYASGQYTAAQLRQAAGQEQAGAVRRANEERRKSRYIESTAQALSAAQGSGGADFERIADLAGEGEYRALMAMYEGEEAAAGLRARARAAMIEGKNRRAASRLQAFAIGATGAASPELGLFAAGAGLANQGPSSPSGVPLTSGSRTGLAGSGDSFRSRYG